MCVPSTLIRIQAKHRVLAAKTNAEGPASRGSALGVGDLHDVDVAVGGNEVHAAKWVRAAASLSEGRPCLVSQLQGKLGEQGEILWEAGHSHRSEKAQAARTAALLLTVGF